MSLPAQPPKYTGTDFEIFKAQQEPIVPGEQGWRTWALQRNLQVRGFDIVPDGDFGPKTEKKVKLFQNNNDIEPVGFAGPKTQAHLLELLAAGVIVTGLPKTLAKGFNAAEGAHMVAPVNWYTPPKAPPGVDCGPVQWRQYGPPFMEGKLMLAFDAEASFVWALNVIALRCNQYKARRPSLSNTLALRLALLAHNWPAGADMYVRDGGWANPGALCMWTNNKKGGHYTRAQWFQVYPDKILSAAGLL